MNFFLFVCVICGCVGLTCALGLLLSGREGEPRIDSGYYHENSGEKNVEINFTESLLRMAADDVEGVYDFPYF